MNKKRIGFNKLVEVIGKDFFECHKYTAVFSTEETDKGLFCFLGIDLHPEKARLCLSATMDEWDVYASCYVTVAKVIMDKCKLPTDQTTKVEAGMLSQKSQEILKKIKKPKNIGKEAYECDNDSRFQDLTLEELLYLKEHQELLAFID